MVSPISHKLSNDRKKDQINLLGLDSSVITTSKSSPAAKTRFLQVPETPGLLSIPSSTVSLLSSPLRSILISAVAREVFRPSNRPKGIKDESLDGFMTRRFGEAFARTFGSALIHGVYATDSRKLSVRAAFPSLWEAEERGWGSVVVGFLRGAKSNTKDDYDLGNTAQLMQDTSVYSFRGGMQSLTNALEHHLSVCPNVQVLRDTNVTSLRLQKNKTFEVCIITELICTSAEALSTVIFVIRRTAIPHPCYLNIAPPSLAKPSPWSRLPSPPYRESILLCHRYQYCIPCTTSRDPS